MAPLRAVVLHEPAQKGKLPAHGVFPVAYSEASGDRNHGTRQGLGVALLDHRAPQGRVHPEGGGAAYEPTAAVAAAAVHPEEDVFLDGVSAIILNLTKPGSSISEGVDATDLKHALVAADLRTDQGQQMR